MDIWKYPSSHQWLLKIPTLTLIFAWLTQILQKVSLHWMISRTSWFSLTAVWQANDCSPRHLGFPLCFSISITYGLFMNAITSSMNQFDWNVCLLSVSCLHTVAVCSDMKRIKAALVFIVTKWIKCVTRKASLMVTNPQYQTSAPILASIRIVSIVQGKN